MTHYKTLCTINSVSNNVMNSCEVVSTRVDNRSLPSEYGFQRNHLQGKIFKVAERIIRNVMNPSEVVEQYFAEIVLSGWKELHGGEEYFDGWFNEEMFEEDRRFTISIHVRSISNYYFLVNFMGAFHCVYQSSIDSFTGSTSPIAPQQQFTLTVPLSCQKKTLV